MTAAQLRERALTHIARYNCTVEGLRRVLVRGITRNRMALSRNTFGQTSEPQEMLVSEADIEPLLKEFIGKGYLDDLKFAERFIEVKTSSGMSVRTAQQKLSLKGVDRTLVDDVVEELDPDDFEAAKITARKKKIGPFRLADRDTHRQKDMAVLARRGFSYETCRLVVDGDADDQDSGSD